MPPNRDEPAAIEQGATTRVLLSRLVAIALPMIISQASETAMLFVDRLFLARVSKVHLAAAMAGGLTNFTVVSVFAGIAGYVNAIVAQYYGANQRTQCARSTFQALLFSVSTVPIVLLIARVIPGFFGIMGHDPAQVPLETTYAQWLISGSVILLMRNALTGFFLGIGRTRIVMIANIAAAFVNIPLNYVLIFGAFGLPALGMTGAAIGTLGGGLTALLILAIGYLSRRVDEAYQTRSARSFDRALFGRLIRFGGPAGIEIFLNVLAFNLFVQLMHGYGSDVAAAITIAFNWDIVSFIPMLGLGVATTAVVGQYMGANDIDGARRTTLLSLRIGWAYTGAMMVLFLVATGPLVRVFSGGFDDAASVEPLARVMLRLAGLYVMADSTQLVFAGALRGAGDTAWVMRMSAILHWVFAAIVIVLIRVVVASPIVVWVVFIVFVITLGAAMVLRFRTGAWQQMRVI
ncbi:MAG: MATE family efflux transporter [Spirochaetaceae bacterium]|nr:MAG: MATE family efflux transporter [Spirochaetaceae bacterium]